MQNITIYRYLRESGGVTVSPEKPDCEYTEMHRLIADDNKLLTNGEITTCCIDVESADGWYEIEDETEKAESELKNV